MFVLAVGRAGCRAQICGQTAPTPPVRSLPRRVGMTCEVRGGWASVRRGIWHAVVPPAQALGGSHC